MSFLKKLFTREEDLVIINKPAKLSKEEKIIMAIHHEVDTAQDRILAEAKEILATAAKKDFISTTEEIELLESLGFTNSKKVRDLREKNKLISQQNVEIEKVLSKAKTNANLIIDYSVKYPQYKFITHDVIIYLMNKYNLHIGPISAYTGEIPLKNLKELRDGKQIEDKDKSGSTIFVRIKKEKFYEKSSHNYSYNESLEVIESLRKGILLLCHWDIKSTNQLWERALCTFVGKSSYSYSNLQACEFDILHLGSENCILAPINHFDEKEMDKYTTTVKKEDPVVFQFVVGGALVKTKWGLEASDPELLNEKEN